jgi:hypothetical protein
MANHQESRGNQARKRPHRGPGELQDLRRKVWQAVLEAEALLMRPRASISTKLRAIHALTQVAMAYQRIVQGTELEDRVAALEAAVQRRRNGYHVAQ